MLQGQHVQKPRLEGESTLKGDLLRQKMVLYNKYHSIQRNFSWWQFFGNPKFKQKSFGMNDNFL
jgi:hypothetical protein